MRRTARALSVALFAGAALALAGPAGAAAPSPGTGSAAPAAPTAGTGPADCAPITGQVPRMPGTTRPPQAGPAPAAGDGADRVPGPTSRPSGTPAKPCGDTRACADGKSCGDTQQGCAQGTSCTGTGSRCRAGEDCDGQDGCRAGQQCADDERQCAGGGEGSRAGAGDGACGDDDRECARGGCPDDEDSCREPRAGGGDEGGDDCVPAGTRHGVAAGTGGSFGASVPTLVAGGVLIAAGCAGAGYRVHGRVRTGRGARPADV
ncbi:hypothetical protein HZZ00_25275 [Streptomyces sp. NEAU-sy36]|uniref:hypothetical protein n=1 Tax=unclassified Streptomyces TaxID=2593676 RepID=UPI0015D649F6|nr:MULTISPECIES: hypothetical protein [unclassified Streptomyces]QLJ03979.1 hypothetical protein HZZ00_25275 [Streptomyces sp. NEAU-sy36]